MLQSSGLSAAMSLKALHAAIVSHVKQRGLTKETDTVDIFKEVWNIVSELLTYSRKFETLSMNYWHIQGSLKHCQWTIDIFKEVWNIAYQFTLHTQHIPPYRWLRLTESVVNSSRMQWLWYFACSFIVGEGWVGGKRKSNYVKTSPVYWEM